MKTRILFAGLGSIGQRHLRNLRLLLGDTVDIGAYRALRQSPVLGDKMNVESGNTLEAKYNLRIFENLETALSWQPCAVFICNPNSLHVPVAHAAARAGCHLFIEKPLSHDLDQVEELCQTVERNGLVALIAYQMRFHPCLQQTHILLKNRSIGRVLSVHAEVGEYLPDWHPWEDYRQSYASRKELGGGALLVQIHEMDYLYWLFGKPSRIYAVGGQLSSLEIDVEDTVSTLMDCAGVPVHLQQDFVQRPSRRTLLIVGNEGKIFVDFNALSLQVHRGSGEIVENRVWQGFDRNQLFLDEITHFLACIEGKERPLVTIRDGAQSLRMALAAKESLAKLCLIYLS